MAVRGRGKAPESRARGGRATANEKGNGEKKNRAEPIQKARLFLFSVPASPRMRV